MPYNLTSNPPLSPPTSDSMLKFLETFYATSDTESEHENYVASFTEDATLIMGPKVAKGSNEIRNLRLGLWTHVKSRRHFPTKVFFGGERELMLYGTVRYVLRKGGEVEVPWAARVVFDERELKMGFYRVYLDSAAQEGVR